MAANGSSARLNATPFPSGSPRSLKHFYLLPNSVKFYIDLFLLFKDIDCVFLLYCLLAAFPRAVYLLPCTTTHGKAPNRSLPLLFAPAFRTTLFFFLYFFTLPPGLHPLFNYTQSNAIEVMKIFLAAALTVSEIKLSTCAYMKQDGLQRTEKKKKLWLHPHLVLCFFSLANGLSYILL